MFLTKGFIYLLVHIVVEPKVVNRKFVDDADFWNDFGNMLKVVRDVTHSEESNLWVTYRKNFGMKFSTEAKGNADPA